MALGALLLAYPRFLRPLAAGRGGPPPPWIVRALGARTALQGLLLVSAARSGGRRSFRLGALVDTLHAASMVAAAYVWPSYRRSALLSAGAASSLAAGQATIGFSGVVTG